GDGAAFVEQLERDGAALFGLVRLAYRRAHQAGQPGERGELHPFRPHVAQDLAADAALDGRAAERGLELLAARRGGAGTLAEDEAVQHAAELVDLARRGQ